MAADSHIASFLLDSTLQTAKTFADTASAKMISIIAPVGATLLICYVLLWAAAMAAGQISEPFTDGMKRIIRMTVIIAFALTAGVYQGTVADFALAAPNNLAQQLQDSLPAVTSDCGYTPSGGETALANSLDQSAAVGFCLGGKAWQKASLANVGLYFVAVITDAATAVIVAIAAGTLFLVYLTLAVLLAVGPLFILFAIFTQTQRWFESWLGQIVNYMVTFLLVSCVISLAFAIFDQFMTSILADYTGPDVLMDCLRLLGMSVAVVMVMLQIKHVAAAIGGGAAVTAGGVAGRLAGIGAGAGRMASTGSARTPAFAGASQKISPGNAAAAVGRTTVRLARRVFSKSNSNSIRES